MPTHNRRTVLKGICASGGSLLLPSNVFAGLRSQGSRDPIRLGVIADLHGGLASDADQRLDAFLAAMASQELDALVQLGDFAFPNEKHQDFADKLNSAHKNVIHVIGNHEFDFGLTRNDCFEAWGIEAAYYPRDVGGVKILVLDGNEKGSPRHGGGYPSYIGKQQQEWLSQELESTDLPVLVLSHQPLAGSSAVDNAKQMQKLLTQHKDKILICLNGHSHVDQLLQVDGVNYVHLNSASYYWVGGKQRMAYYQEPLFSTVTINPSQNKILIEGRTSRWRSESDPNKTGYFASDTAPPETIVVPAIRNRRLVEKHLASPEIAERPTGDTTLTVMAWNIWGRLNQDPRYTINDQTARHRAIEIIRESNADIVAMVETYGSASDIATALGFHHHTPASDANLCIFSRYPLSDIEKLEGLSPFSFIGATVTLPNQRQVRIYDIWLTSGGRHLVEIKNTEISDQEFCDGDDIRYDMLKLFLEHEDVKKHLKNADQIPVIVAGDFNCVSHLDHTQGTRHSKLNHSRILPTKVSKSMHAAGFTDTYRATNPDILSSTLGHTWTTVGMGYVYKSNEGFVPVEENPEPHFRDPYARIDFIYSKGSALAPVSSQVIAHHSSATDRSFPEFPSDHAAVLTEFELKNQN